MSSRRNPFEDLERMIDRMSRQFDEATRQWGGEDWRVLGGGGDLAIDVLDRDDEFVVTVDVPGYDGDELDLRVTEEALRISGERQESIEDESESYLRRERRQESVRREVRLPAPVKPEEATAELRNGILTVTIPKAGGASESQKVEIEGS